MIFGRKNKDPFAEDGGSQGWTPKAPRSPKNIGKWVIVIAAVVHRFYLTACLKPREEEEPEEESVE